MIGILDALGYLLVMGALFFPVFWFLGYLFTSLIRILWQGQSLRDQESEEQKPSIQDHRKPPVKAA
jgi:hypothetical protein